MKYLYKAAGIVVESDSALDSTMFQPVKMENMEKHEELQETAAPTKTTTRKRTSRKKQVG